MAFVFKSLTFAGGRDTVFTVFASSRYRNEVSWIERSNTFERKRRDEEISSKLRDVGGGDDWLSRSVGAHWTANAKDCKAYDYNRFAQRCLRFWIVEEHFIRRGGGGQGRVATAKHAQSTFDAPHNRNHMYLSIMNYITSLISARAPQMSNTMPSTSPIPSHTCWTYRNM